MDDQEKEPIESNEPIDGQIGLEDLYYEMSQKENQPEIVSSEPLDGQVTFDDLTQSISSAQDKQIEKTEDIQENILQEDFETLQNESQETTHEQSQENSTLQDDIVEQEDEQLLNNTAIDNFEILQDSTVGREKNIEKLEDDKSYLTEQTIDENQVEMPIEEIAEQLDESGGDSAEVDEDLEPQETSSEEESVENQQVEMVGDIELSSLGNIFKQDVKIEKPKTPRKTSFKQQFLSEKQDGDYKEKIEEILDTEKAIADEKAFEKMKEEKKKGEKAVEADFFDDKIEQPDNKSQDNNGSGNGNGTTGLFYKNLDEVLHESMIPYSEHVIMDRALPRVEDGLKPVQRRILYSMLDLGITPDKPYRKSARIVGDCLGKYHPHGDSSVYDAMVRMAQPFNMNELLVNGHGNFGSIDGDKAAAMRYTEARLAPLAMELLKDLEKDTVKWSLNFDDTIKEPDTLPGRFPNLLVNGAMGIAVGLATNIPPHNLAEVIDGVVTYIYKPTITLKELMKYIKAPDFPTGGYILPSSEIEQAFATGRGKIIMRAKMHIEGGETDKRSVVITELPYQVNKSTILQKIASLREEGKHPALNGIADIRDESDRNGLRAVIKIKKDGNLKTIVETLLKYTDLQCSFGVNMVAIANGKPKLMGIIDIISYYVEYQREVVLRRTKFDLERTKERLHILEGLLIAIKNIDEVIKIIKTSPNVSTARQRLRDRFALSERQAQAILDMKLARLTNLEVNNLQEEIKKNRALVEELTKIVNSKKLQFEVVKTEILAIKKQYKQDRKSIILKTDALDLPSDSDKEQVIEGYIGVNASGNIKFMNKKTFSSATKEYKETSTLHEVHTIITKTDSEKTAYIFTNKGNCYKFPVKNIPEGRFKDKGTPFASVVKCEKGEMPVAIYSIDEDMPKGSLLFMTKQGIVKKTAFKEYGVSKSTFQAMKLKDDDEVISIELDEKNTTIVFVTKNGMVLNADKSDIPVQGRISGGVKGINLSDGDNVVFSGQVTEDGEIVMLTNRGFIKRVVVSQIDVMARYRKGVKIITLSEKDNGTALIYADYVKDSFDVVAVDEDKKLYGRNTDVCPIEARTGKGKLIEKMKNPPKFVFGFKYKTN